MYILGISAYYHDSAACILKNGEIIAAAQEERFTRKKHDQNFPSNAIRYCLEEANIQSPELGLVAFYDKPFLKFERILETYLAYAPKGINSFLKAIPLWIRKKLWIKAYLDYKTESQTVNGPLDEFIQNRDQIVTGLKFFYDWN